MKESMRTMSHQIEKNQWIEIVKENQIEIMELKLYM